MAKGLKKYSNGTTITNYIPNPKDLIKANNKLVHQAELDYSNDELTSFRDMLPGLIKIFGKDMAKTLQNYAYGGNIANVPVEIEGGEMGEEPDGNVFEAKGPTHEEGGIPVSLPEGTDIYSKRIKVKGKSMAQRKKDRANKEKHIKNLLNNDNTDSVLKNTLERTEAVNKQEDSFDMEIQKIISDSLNENKNKKEEYQTGGVVKEKDEKNDNKLYNNSIFSEENLQEYANNFLDALSFYKSTNDSLKNTEENYAGSLPNVNAYKDFGAKGLETLKQVVPTLNVNKQQDLKDLQSSKHSSINRSRNTARGVNTLRSLDLLNEQMYNEHKNKISTSYNNQLMNLLTGISNKQDAQDRMVMQGESAKNLADIQDRDAYYTQKGVDLANKNLGLQMFRNMLQTRGKNKKIHKLINKFSPYGITIDKLLNSKG